MFINEYLMDKKLYKEFVWKISFKSLLIFCIIYVVICTLFYFLTYDITFVICDLVIIILAAIYPVLICNKFLKRALEMNDGVLNKTVVTISDKIYMDEGKNHLEFGFDKVVKVKETKNLLFLKFKSKSGVVIYKEGFTKGTLPEFKEFLKIKGLY